MEQRRHSDFTKIMDLIKANVLQQTYNQEMMLRMRKIIRRETSFLYGFTECIAQNFDPIFRYLFAMSFILMQAVNYIHQLDATQAFSFLAAAIIVTLIFIAGLLINIILYRKKKSNLNFPQAVVFYLKCKCFVASSVIDNYD